MKTTNQTKETKTEKVIVKRFEGNLSDAVNIQQSKDYIIESYEQGLNYSSEDHIRRADYERLATEYVENLNVLENDYLIVEDSNVSESGFYEDEDGNSYLFIISISDFVSAIENAHEYILEDE